jgi:hypothetical protein
MGVVVIPLMSAANTRIYIRRCGNLTQKGGDKYDDISRNSDDYAVRSFSCSCGTHDDQDEA